MIIKSANDGFRVKNTYTRPKGSITRELNKMPTTKQMPYQDRLGKTIIDNSSKHVDKLRNSGVKTLPKVFGVNEFASQQPVKKVSFFDKIELAQANQLGDSPKKSFFQRIKAHRNFVDTKNNELPLNSLNQLNGSAPNQVNSISQTPTTNKTTSGFWKTPSWKRTAAVGGIATGVGALGAYLWNQHKKKDALQKSAMHIYRYYY